MWLRTWSVALCLLLLCLLQSGCGGEVPPSAPEVVFQIDPQGEGWIEVRGLGTARARQLDRTLDGEEWSTRFGVYTGTVLPAADQPGLLGDWRVVEGQVRFEPRFALLPEQPYVAVWRQAGAVVAQARFTLPAGGDRPPTVVAGIYPSADLLPENLLRFYVQFSASMSRGGAAEHVRLYDDRGTEVQDPFVVPQQELWNPATDRLTLIIDPGRIKRGVGPNETLGPMLRVGQTYRLVVAEGWLDGRSRPLADPFEKTFRVGPADRQSPDPQQWRIEVPADSQADLVVRFVEPLDHALARRMMGVETAAGERLEGQIHIEPGEMGWRFAPRTPWRRGEYRLIVDPALEDLAGNSPRKLFDEASGAAAAEPMGQIELPFRFG